jgi:spermidine synthase
MNRMFVYLAVIVGGASVLALEILGTRIIAPFYGNSIYLWSALISVTLAALAFGYWLGGKWADRGATVQRLSLILGLSGLWIIIVPWVAQPLLSMTESLGLRAAVLISATVLFFPPLALLGIISPYAIRLRAESIDVVGRTAGNLYALSTIASVVAAIATGFFLIPVVGVQRLMFLIGLLLIGTAVAGILGKKKPAGAMAGIIFLAGLPTLGYNFCPVEKADPENGLLAIQESPYGELRVVDQDQVRYLLVDRGAHTAASTTSVESKFPYVNVLEIVKYVAQNPGDMLVVGLGGASVVRSYVKDGWTVDAVEIDPAVTRMAREYFGLLSDDAAVFEMDGRRYLATTDKKYDLIVLDAFGSSYIPFHLVSDEAFALIHERLVPGGILAMNIWTQGWQDRTAQRVAATLQRHFKFVKALPIAEPPDQLGNMIIIASDQEPKLQRELPPVYYRMTPAYEINHAWDNSFIFDTAGVAIITDDLNPTDLWAERVNYASRIELHAVNKKGQVAW